VDSPYRVEVVVSTASDRVLDKLDSIWFELLWGSFNLMQAV
jgi:hypothetical protein